MDNGPDHLRHLCRTLLSSSLINQTHTVRIRIDTIDVKRCHHIPSIRDCHNKCLIPERRQEINQIIQTIYCDVNRFQLQTTFGEQALVLKNHTAFHRHTEDGTPFVIPVFPPDDAVIIDVAALL